MKKYAVICLAATLALVCVFKMTDRAAAQGEAAAPPPALPEINRENIPAHVKFLASDLLEGRGRGHHGEDIAPNSIAPQVALSELKQAGDNGTYFQDVPMVGVKALPETTFKFTEASGKSFEAKNLTDFVTNNESQTEA